MLALGNFVIGTGSFVIAGILPKIAGDLNVSITTAGQLVTIYALTYAIVSPLLAAFTSRLPRRTLLISALLLFSGANLLAALAPNFEILFLARMLSGVGGALYTPTSSAVAVTITPPAERGRALATVFAGLAIANVLGIPFGTFIGSNFGWRITFALVAVLGLLAIIAILVIIKEMATTAPVVLSQWFGLLKRGKLVVAMSVTLAQFTAQFAVFTYIAPLLTQNIGLDGNSISLMLLIFGAAGALGNNLGGMVADRWNLVRLLIISVSGLAAVLFAFPWLASSLVGAIIGFFIWGLTGFLFNPVQQTRLVGFAPQTPGLVLSLNSSMLYLGNACGAALGGVIVSNFSIAATCWFGGILALIALALVLLSTTMKDKPALAAPFAEALPEPGLD